MQFFESNISSLQKQNIGFAEKVESIKEVVEFELFMDEGDYTTLNFIHKTDFLPLYESKPKEEISKSLEAFGELENHPYLYMYGLGNGALVKELLQNKKLKRIVVIEPEVEIAHIVLHLVDFSAELDEGRLILFGSDDVNFAALYPLFPGLDEQRYARVYDMHANTSYYQKKHSQSLRRANQTMLETIYHAINIAGNDTKDALIGLKQHIINIPVMLETPPLHHFFKQLKYKESAILVSTGPSLTKQLPLLKKIAPYVRIIAVDASFPVLYNAGIKPDVVVSMERVPQSARFFKELPEEAFEDVIFALSSLQHKNVVESIKGGQMQMSMRPLGYMTYLGPEQWGYMGIGQSAANMAYELVFQSRFKHCILIGQDLAYAEDGSSHADGHVFGMDNVKQKETDTWAVGWGGQTAVQTNHTWTMFRNFFEKDVADTQGILDAINATEGGARIAGTIEMPFSDAVKKYVKNKKKKPKISFMKVLEKEKIRLSGEIEQRLDSMSEYVSRLLEELKSLFLETAALSEAIEENKGHTQEQLENILTKIESLSRYHNDELYDLVVWHIAQSMMLVQELRIAPLEVYKPKNSAESLERLELLVHAYKPWLFSYCGVLDATLKTIEYARARRLIKKVENIEVYIGENVIDTISIENMQAKHGRVFDVDMRGILYDAPDDYQTQLNTVAFRDAESGEELPRAFVDVIVRDDEKYKELMFGNHLKEIAKVPKVVEQTPRDAIGFMATEKNLDDTAFIEFVSLLKEQKYGVPFVAFCFNETQQKKALEVFGDDTEIVFPETLEDVASSVSVYLYSRVSKDGSLFSDAKVKNIFLRNALSPFVIRLDEKIESKDFLHSISLYKSDLKRSFLKSVVSKILYKHKKFNEYTFINSLTCDVDESLDSTKSNDAVETVGFLITRENLEDGEYIEYINRFVTMFPNLQTNVYFFENLDIDAGQYFHKSLNIVSLDNVKKLYSSIDMFIGKSQICQHVINVLMQKAPHIYSVVINSAFKNMTIHSYAQMSENHKIWKFYKQLGLSEKEKKESENIFHRFLYQPIYDELNIPYKIDIEKSLYEYEYYIKVEHIIKYPSFRQKVTARLNLLKGL